MNVDHSVMQFYAKPRLLKLTHIPHPEVAGGNPTVCFVTSGEIVAIKRGVIRHNPPADADPSKYGIPMECTVITIYGSEPLLVTELPEEIARLRELAIAYKPAMEPVK